MGLFKLDGIECIINLPVCRRVLSVLIEMAVGEDEAVSMPGVSCVVEGEVLMLEEVCVVKGEVLMLEEVCVVGSEVLMLGVCVVRGKCEVVVML